MLASVEKNNYLCTTIGNSATKGEVGEWLKPPVC